MELMIAPRAPLPVVHLEILLEGGALSDPVGMEGLSAMMGQMLQEGPRGMTRTSLDAALASLGAELSVQVSRHAIRFSAVCLAHRTRALLDLIARVLRAPAFRKPDLVRCRRESCERLLLRAESDRALAGIALRKQVFGRHAWGRPIAGTPSSLEGIDVPALRKRHAAMMASPRALVGIAGPSSFAALRGQVESGLGGLFPNAASSIEEVGNPSINERQQPKAAPSTAALSSASASAAAQHIKASKRNPPGEQNIPGEQRRPASPRTQGAASGLGRSPRVRRGQHLLVVDKPARTQVQIAVGSLGIHAGHRDEEALLVANTIFGGTFSCRLNQAIRVRRGWSYEVGSQLTLDRHRDLWSMWSTPASEKAAPCLRTQLTMFARLRDAGVKGNELRFAVNHMLGAACFDEDTAARRLDEHMTARFYGLPDDHRAQRFATLRAMTPGIVQDALQRSLSAENLSIVVVGTAQRILPSLARLQGLASVRVQPYRDFV